MADSNDGASLVLDIVFDDGSVQQGFVRLANLSNQTSKKVGDDFKGTKLLDFEKMRDEGTSAISDLGGSLTKFGVIAGLVGATLAGIKETLSLGFEGEGIRAINAQFDILSESAGIAGDKLRESLAKAADGLVDMDDMLKTANSAMINLGENARSLPEILELARKATLAMGGDLGQRFDGIVSAIESGNAKALKAQGIIIDSEKAYREYANAIGLTTSELNLSQKQSAILNAALVQGAEKFKNISGEVQPGTDNLKRFQVAMKELKDNIAEGISSSGPFTGFTNWLGALARGSKIDNADLVNAADLVAKRMKLEQEMNKLRENVLKSGVTDVENSSVGYILSGYVKQIDEVNKQLRATGAVVKSNSSEMVKAAKDAAASSSSTTGGVNAKFDAAQVGALKMRELAKQEALNQSALVQNEIEQKQTAFLLSEYDKRIVQAQLYAQKGVLLEQEFTLKRAELEAQRQAGIIQSQTEFQTRLIQLQNDYNSKRAANSIAAAQAEVQSLAMYSNATSGWNAAFEGFTLAIDGAKSAAKDFAINASANFRAVGKQMFSSIGSAAANAFSAFGSAIVRGEDALQGFIDSLLASMGQMAVQLGTQFILQGAAMMWAGLPNGGPLIAAGAALATFGGVLSALGGGSATSGGTAGDTGGGISSTGTSTTTEVTSPKDLERKDPDTYINLNINGDVLDSDETGMRIIDLVNSAFDKSGVKIQRRAVA